MMESNLPICNTCGEQVGLGSNGEVFVACYECNFPLCPHCLDYEINQGRNSCIRCATPYGGDATKSSSFLIALFMLCSYQ